MIRLLSHPLEIRFNPFADLVRFAFTKFPFEPLNRIAIYLARITCTTSRKYIGGDSTYSQFRIDGDKVIDSQFESMEQSLRLPTICASAFPPIQATYPIGSGKDRCLRFLSRASYSLELLGFLGMSLTILARSLNLSMRILFAFTLFTFLTYSGMGKVVNPSFLILFLCVFAVKIAHFLTSTIFTEPLMPISRTAILVEFGNGESAVTTRAELAIHSASLSLYHWFLPAGGVIDRFSGATLADNSIIPRLRLAALREGA